MRMSIEVKREMHENLRISIKRQKIQKKEASNNNHGVANTRTYLIEKINEEFNSRPD